MTLDTTPGGTSADSYLTVAEADDIAETSDYGPQANAWLALSDEDDKERLLRQATRDVDRKADSGWLRYTGASQPLAFPRAEDGAGTPRAPYVQPRARMATYYQAIYLLATAKARAAADVRYARKLASFSEPSVSGTQAVETPPDDFAPRAQLEIDALPATAGDSTKRLQSIRVSGPPIGAWTP